MPSRVKEIFVRYIGPLICLVVMGVINLYIYFILMITAFGLFDCGEDLNEWHDVGGAFIGAVILFAIQLLITYLLRKAQWYFWAFALVTAASFLVAVYFGICFANYGHYYQDFDEIEWKASKDMKPMAMVRKMYDDKRYIGKTREKILTDLGSPSRNLDNKLSYTTDQYSELVFELNNNVVVGYYVYCDD